MTPEALVAATAGPINDVGARFYFHPDTLTRGKELGLDGFRFYVLGRGGVLGDVEAPVIASAFGYFSPAVIDKMWSSARETMAPRDAARAYLVCNADLGRAHLADVGGLDEFCAAAEQVCTALNPAGLALFAGIAAEPLPDDLPARAMQLIVAHRELRGCLHLAAIVAAGVDPAAAHAFRRPGDVESFGWPADLAVPAGVADAMAQVDATTDALTANAYRPLDEDQRQAFADGVAAIEQAFGS